VSTVEHFTVVRREEWAVDQASVNPFPATSEADARRIAATCGGSPVSREIMMLTGEWKHHER
jgi:hypothetical protein